MGSESNLNNANPFAPGNAAPRLQPADVAAMVERSLGKEAAAAHEVIATLEGAINDVFRIRVGAQEFALRVRLRENVFRYEKDLLKETVAATYLAADTAPGKTGHNETILDRSIGEARQARQGLASALLPRTVYQDTSRTLVPFPWLLQHWGDGALLLQGTDEAYLRTGKALAELHENGFERFRPTLNDPWQSAGDWIRNMRDEGEKLSDGLGLVLPWQALQEAAGRQVTGFCLNHNDLQPFNIIASEDEILFIDWDNLQIGPPEFDLVKLKYWTECGTDGFLRPNRTKFEWFLTGYQNANGRRISADIFSFCETVWLLRVMRFETTRAVQGHLPTQPFRGADYYRDCLISLFEGKQE